MNNQLDTLPTLPKPIHDLLKQLVQSAKKSFGDELKSVVLFGSGAEGRLQATSDLNLMIVLKRFDKDRVDSFREPLRMACMACKTAAMFILDSELSSAAEAFAVKFDDIARRHRVLYGDDPMSGIAASRAARKQRLRQVLINLTLRLRERYASISLREEKLVVVIADSLSPLRSAALTLLELEGKSGITLDDALKLVASEIPGGDEALNLAQEARAKQNLPPTAAASVVFKLMALAESMRIRTDKLA